MSWLVQFQIFLVGVGVVVGTGLLDPAQSDRGKRGLQQLSPENHQKNPPTPPTNIQIQGSELGTGNGTVTVGPGGPNATTTTPVPVVANATNTTDGFNVTESPYPPRNLNYT